MNKQNNWKERLEEIVETIVNTIADQPCCKVCQCENGKKIWCACHRKQIKSFIEKELQAERERIEETLERMNTCVCNGGFMKRFNAWHRSDCKLKNKTYTQALTEAMKVVRDNREKI